jgi:hypothetical protein
MRKHNRLHLVIYFIASLVIAVITYFAGMEVDIWDD